MKSYRICASSSWLGFSRRSYIVELWNSLRKRTVQLFSGYSFHIQKIGKTDKSVVGHYRLSQFPCLIETALQKKQTSTETI